MAKLINLNDIEDKNSFINLLKNKNITIYEDIQGSRILVNFNGKEINIKPRNITNDSISELDLIVQKFYHKAYHFFFKLDINIKRKMKPDWWFVFEYFPDNQPANINYKKTPKNSLILTGIIKNKKFYFDLEEIRLWSDALNLNYPPIIFHGKLTEKQLKSILYFLNTSKEDLKLLFNTDNFASFFYKILNPNETNSFMMNYGEYNPNIEKIIIRIDNYKEFNYQILNPFYEKILDTNNTNYTEIYSLIVVNFLEFLQTKNYNNIDIIGTSTDESYINLMCLLFNEYINSNYKNIQRLNIQIPEFFIKDKFRINFSLITNSETKELASNDTLKEYILKIILTTFNKEKSKTFGLVDDKLLVLLNDEINKIKNKINQDLGIIQDNLLKIKGII